MQGTRVNWRRIIFSIIIPIVVIFACIFIDQITKKAFKDLYNEVGKTTIIPGFFYLTYTVNTGAAWSFLANVSWGQTFFKIISSLALVLFSLYFTP